MNKHWTFLIIQKKEAVISDKNICQWTKNINLSRKCNVCEEVLENVGCIAIDKNKVVQRVELDMKKIIDVQNKLSNGKDVDQRDISVLLLGGVMNILHQHDALEKLEE